MNKYDAFSNPIVSKIDNSSIPESTIGNAYNNEELDQQLTFSLHNSNNNINNIVVPVIPNKNYYYLKSVYQLILFNSDDFEKQNSKIFNIVIDYDFSSDSLFFDSYNSLRNEIRGSGNSTNKQQLVRDLNSTSNKNIFSLKRNDTLTPWKLFKSWDEYDKMTDGDVLFIIEYCCNCDGHNENNNIRGYVRHNEAKYKEEAEKIKNFIKDKFGYKVLLRPFDFKPKKIHPGWFYPLGAVHRKGALEVQLITMNNGLLMCHLVFSKLVNNVYGMNDGLTELWPNISKIEYIIRHLLLGSGIIIKDEDKNLLTETPTMYSITTNAIPIELIFKKELLPESYREFSNFPSSNVILTYSFAKQISAEGCDIEWITPNNIFYGTPLGQLQLNASCFNLSEGDYISKYNPKNGSILTVGTHQLDVKVIPRGNLNFVTTERIVEIQVQKATPVVVWDPPLDIVYGTSLSKTQMNATCLSNGYFDFNYNLDIGIVLPVGVHTLKVTVIPIDIENYSDTEKSVEIRVKKIIPLIVWNISHSITYGTRLGTNELNATCKNCELFDFIYIPKIGEIVSAGIQTLSVTVVPHDSNNYFPIKKSLDILVNKNTPQIAWNSPKNSITFGVPLSNFHLNAKCINITESEIVLKYSPNFGDILPVGVHNLLVIAEPLDKSNYVTVEKVVEIIVIDKTDFEKYSDKESSVLQKENDTRHEGSYDDKYENRIQLEKTKSVNENNFIIFLQESLLKHEGMVDDKCSNVINSTIDESTDQINFSEIISPVDSSPYPKASFDGEIIFKKENLQKYEGSYDDKCINIVRLEIFKLSKERSLFRLLEENQSKIEGMFDDKCCNIIHSIINEALLHLDIPDTLLPELPILPKPIHSKPPIIIEPFNPEINPSNVPKPPPPRPTPKIPTISPPEKKKPWRFPWPFRTPPIIPEVIPPSEKQPRKKPFPLSWPFRTPSIITTINEKDFQLFLAENKLKTDGSFDDKHILLLIIDSKIKTHLENFNTSCDTGLLMELQNKIEGSKDDHSPNTLNNSSANIISIDSKNDFDSIQLKEHIMKVEGSFDDKSLLISTKSWIQTRNEILINNSFEDSIFFNELNNKTDGANDDMLLNTIVGKRKARLNSVNDISQIYLIPNFKIKIEGSYNSKDENTFKKEAKQSVTMFDHHLHTLNEIEQRIDGSKDDKLNNYYDETINPSFECNKEYRLIIMELDRKYDGSKYDKDNNLIKDRKFGVIKNEIIQLNILRKVDNKIDSSVDDKLLNTIREIEKIYNPYTDSEIGIINENFYKIEGSKNDKEFDTMTINITVYRRDDYNHMLAEIENKADGSSHDKDCNTIKKKRIVPELVWLNPSSIYYGSELNHDHQLNAQCTNTSIEGRLIYHPGPGVILIPGVYELKVVFIPYNNDEFEKTQSFVLLEVLKRSSSIDWDIPDYLIYGERLTSRHLNAVCVDKDIKGSFNFQPGLETILKPGIHQLLVTFDPQEENLFIGSRLTKTVEVRLLPIELLWNPSDIVFGTPLDEKHLNVIAKCENIIINGRYAYSPTKGSILSAGDHDLSVIFYPDDSEFTVCKKSISIVVAKFTPQLRWIPSDMVYGNPVGAKQLCAKVVDNIVGSFTYYPEIGTFLESGKQPLKVIYTPDAFDNYATVELVVYVKVKKFKPLLGWNIPDDISFGERLSTVQLNAYSFYDTAPNYISGHMEYIPEEGTILPVGEHTLRAIFKPLDSKNFKTSEITVNIIVEKVIPKISWDNPKDISYGELLTSKQLNAFLLKKVEGEIIYDPPFDTLLDIGKHQLKVTFVPTMSFSLPKCSKYVTITVNKILPSILWDSPKSITYPDPLSERELCAKIEKITINGKFEYRPPLGTVLDIGTHALSVAFIPDNNNYYLSAYTSVIIKVKAFRPMSASTNLFNNDVSNNNNNNNNNMTQSPKDRVYTMYPYKHPQYVYDT